jgi:hypothetical protein
MQHHVPILSKIQLKRYLGGKSYFAVEKNSGFAGREMVNRFYN